MSERAEIRLTVPWVAAAMAGSIVSGPADGEFTGVSIDTRTIRRGELYVAIRGERFDGVDFAGAAVDSGAAGVVVPRGRAIRAREGVAVFEVDDTVAALQAVALRVRRESGARVVAITGSAGKTTTKEVTAAFLATKYHVIRNRGNLNNHIGLPLSLIDLRQRPDVAVVELGMNHAGEISALVGIAEPEIRVWTNVGEAHLGFFDSIEAIANAKAEIFEGANASTVLVANADDHRIAARTGLFGGRVVTFGVSQAAEVRATNVVDRGIDGTSARVTTSRGGLDVTTPLIGRGNLENVLAGIAVALEFDVPLDAIAARAGELEPAAHRGQVIRLSGGITVIDDSYNANPTATRKALEVLAGEPTARRRVAVLGEMLELGDHSVAWHEEVGRAAARAGLSFLVAVGDSPARMLAGAAIESGLAPDAVRYCATSTEAADVVANAVQSGDLVLVKGSRGIRTDRVVDRLKAERG